MKKLLVFFVATISLSAFTNPTRDFRVDCSLSAKVSLLYSPYI